MLNQIAPPPDRVFHALGDPTRAAMVDRLSCGPASVSELARPLHMSLSAVVQHLAVLETCGLVSSRKAGRVRTCRIEPTALRTAEDWVAQRRATWEERLDRLADYLAETADTDAPRPATDAPRSAIDAPRPATDAPRSAIDGARRADGPAEGREGRGEGPVEGRELDMQRKKIVTDRNQHEK